MHQKVDSIICGGYLFPSIAGWSSLVARQAHNLKVAGSNPAPATNSTNDLSRFSGPDFPGLFHGGDKMVTNAFKFCALKELQALLAESGLPLC